MIDAMDYEDFVKLLPFAPNEEKQRVITATDPAMLVVAGAGSGKTAAMSQRIAWHIAAGNVAPDEVLGLTFTRKAARELESRVAELLERVAPKSQLERPTIATYNSFAAEIASSYALLIGKDPRSALLSEAQRWQIVNQIVSEWEPSEEHAFFTDAEHPFSVTSPQRIIDVALTLADSLISHGVPVAAARKQMWAEYRDLEAMMAFKEAAVPKFNRAPFRGTECSAGFARLSKAVPASRLRIAALDVVEAYFAYKAEHSLAEFADQVAWGSEILRKAPHIGEQLRSRYKLVVLDEYQDTSANQAQFLALAFKASQQEQRGFSSVCAVGDSNQAIYGWRGAGANALADFARDFEVSPAARFTLATAFRNSTKILDAANALLQYSPRTDPGMLLGERFSNSSQLERPWIAGGGARDNELAAAGISLDQLVPRPKANPGEVLHIHRHLGEDMYDAIAARFKAEFEQAAQRYQSKSEKGPDVGSDAPQWAPPTAAVLIRKRKYAQQMIKALEKYHLPYEFVGGTSIITTPEIWLVRALLGASFFPNRGDQLIELLHYYGIGPADLKALNAMRRELDPDHSQGISIVEALDQLIVLAQNSDSTPHRLRQRFSPDGWQRLIRVGSIIAAVRARAQVPLGELVRFAIHSLGLHSSAATRLTGGARVRRALTKFVAIASDFSAIEAEATLNGSHKVRAFCDWLAAAEARDQGENDDSATDAPMQLEGLDIEPEAGVVQILTVHAAKGLEWDMVAIPEMVHPQFDAGHPGEEKGWFEAPEQLPVALRADKEHLPAYSVRESLAGREWSEQVLFEVLSRCYLYTHSALTDWANSEKMRLAYVALTRPSELLILGTYDYASELKAQRIYSNIIKKNPDRDLVPTPGSAADPASVKGWQAPAAMHFIKALYTNSPSGAVTPAEDNESQLATPAAFIEWAQNCGFKEPELLSDLDEIEKYLSARNQAETGSAEYPQWPSSISRSVFAADQKNGMQPKLQFESANIQQLHTSADTVIAQLREPANTAVEIPYFTASAIVNLRQNPKDYLLNLRRPIPQEPLYSARRGTAVHAAIAQYYDEPLMINIDSVALADEPLFATDPVLIDASSKLLFQRFQESRFASYQAIAIERAIDVTIGEYPVRCVIDAVFDTSGIPEAPEVTIVDWKTGKRPAGADLESRQYQLAVYRIAWARAHGMPVENVGASFYYLGEPHTQDRELKAIAMNELQLEAAISRSLEQAQGPKQPQSAATTMGSERDQQ